MMAMEMEEEPPDAREALRLWFVSPSPSAGEYGRVVKNAWLHMNRFFEWGCVERRGQRPLVARGRETALHRALLRVSNFLVFAFAVPLVTVLAACHLVCTMPALAFCTACGADGHAECCLAALAVPDDDAPDSTQGWAWLLILPVVGGSLLLAWLCLTVVWAPCIFMMALLSSPLWAPCFLWAACRGVVTFNQLAATLRVVAIWPAYYVYVLGFYDFEDDYYEVDEGGSAEDEDGGEGEVRDYGGVWWLAL